MHSEGGETTKHSNRLSRGSSMVLRFLKNHTGLFTAREIYDVLRKDFDMDAPGLTTVYRSLETLQRLQLVQGVAFDGEKSYESVEQGRHHHHVICTSCNKSIHLEECLVEDMRSRIEDLHGFKVRTHVLEIFGLCETCKAR